MPSGGVARAQRDSGMGEIDGWSIVHELITFRQVGSARSERERWGPGIGGWTGCGSTRILLRQAQDRL